MSTKSEASVGRMGRIVTVWPPVSRTVKGKDPGCGSLMQSSVHENQSPRHPLLRKVSISRAGGLGVAQPRVEMNLGIVW